MKTSIYSDKSECYNNVKEAKRIIRNTLSLAKYAPIYPDFREAAINYIDLLNLSEMSIEDIREYIEHVSDLIKDGISIYEIECYNKLITKLNRELPESKYFIEKIEFNILKITKPMQTILNLIDTVSEVNLDLKNGTIKMIDSYDASDLSVTDIRGYIQHIRDIMYQDINKDKVDCYYRLINKLSIEERIRPFHEQFPELKIDNDEIRLMVVELVKSNKKHDTQIQNFQNINSKKDKQLEKFINDSVSKYLVNGTILASGYEYKTADDENGELDGIIVGKDENEKNTIVFVETKSDMNSGWKVAQKQMNRTLAHWRFLKEIVSDENSTDDIVKYSKDIETLKVKEYKDYRIKCAFGANEFSQETVGQFKQFNKYRWLRIVKVKDDGFQVVRQS